VLTFSQLELTGITYNLPAHTSLTKLKTSWCNLAIIIKMDYGEPMAVKGEKIKSKIIY